MAGISLVRKHALSQYSNADIAKRDIMNALRQFKDLRPEQEIFYFGDGTEKILLNLNGTIPVVYKGKAYNIPIMVWMQDTHPYDPPMVYIKPTGDMSIKVSSNVDSNGKVDIPFLRDWRYPQSDLLGLIQILVMVFGEEPPLFSRSTISKQRHQRQSKQVEPPRYSSSTPSLHREHLSMTGEDNEKRLILFLKLVRLSRDALQIFFDDIFPGYELQNMLADKKHLIMNGEKRIQKDQIPVLYPGGGEPADSCEFGISTMYTLLRNHAENVEPPSNGWGKEPNIDQKRNGDDVERIRIHRNYMSRMIEFEHEMDDFNLKWEDLKQAIIRLSKGSLRGEVAALSP